MIGLVVVFALIVFAPVCVYGQSDEAADCELHVGWPIKDRVFVDGGHGQTMVSPDKHFTCDGHVIEWRFQAKKSYPLLAIVFRAVDDADKLFKIVGINDIPAGDINTPVTYTVPQNELITVKAGDMIGWSFGSPSLAWNQWTYGSTDVLFRYSIHAHLTVDQIANLNGGVVKREYSINATIKPFGDVSGYPCQNGAKYHRMDYGYYCECTTEFTGLHCQDARASVCTPNLNDCLLQQKGIWYIMPDLTRRTWDEAVSKCSELTIGGYSWSILEINNSQEQHILEEFLQNLTSFRTFIGPTWIGQNDRLNEHIWRYVNPPCDCDTAGVYLNWLPGQPNGNTGNNGDQDCAVFFFDNEDDFQDRGCNKRDFTTVCETFSNWNPPYSISSDVSLTIPTTSPIRYADCSSLLPSEANGIHTVSHSSDPSRCYFLFQNSGTFDENVNRCSNYDFLPVDIEDAKENNDIYEAINGAPLDMRKPMLGGYWIGQNDKLSENVWSYSYQSNCHGVYVNFDQEQNQPNSGENCVVMKYDTNDQWHDYPCESKMHFMCKFKQQPITIISTAISSTTTFTATSTDNIITSSRATASTTTLADRITDSSSTGTPTANLTDGVTTVIPSTTKGSTTVPMTTVVDNITTTSSIGAASTPLKVDVTTNQITTKGRTPTATLTDEITTSSGIAASMSTLTDEVTTIPSTAKVTFVSSTTILTNEITTSSNTASFKATLTDGGVTTNNGSPGTTTTLTDDVTASQSTAKKSTASPTTTSTRGIITDRSTTGSTSTLTGPGTTVGTTAALATMLTESDTNAKVRTAASMIASIDRITPGTTTSVTDGITSGPSSTVGSTANREKKIKESDTTIPSTAKSSTATIMTASAAKITTRQTTAIPLTTTTSSSPAKGTTAASTIPILDRFTTERRVGEVTLIDEFEAIVSLVRQNLTFDKAELIIKDLSVTDMMDISLEQEGSINVVRIQTTKPVRAIISQSQNLHTQVSTKFEEKQEVESRIVSRVMSIDFFDQTTGEEISNLEQPVIIVFDTMKPIIPPAEKWEMTPRCSYWNKVDGFWSDDGCKMVTVEGSNVECECDHITSFAVLMQFVSYPLTPMDQKVLKLLTTLGLSVSVICICLTLAIYAYCRLLSTIRFMIHTNLCVALLNSHLIFLAGIEVNKNQEKACTAIAFLLHYFLMSTFFWMLVEAMYLLMKTKAALSRRKVPVLAWFSVGWGLPLIIVAVSAIYNLDGYGYPVFAFTEDNKPKIVQTYRCWLDVESGMIWAFTGPACFIIAVNFAILYMVLSTFVSLKATKDKSQFQRIKSSVRAVLILGAILGLPWIFSLLNFSQYTVVFNYLFVLTNALQGVFILINQCLIDSEVQSRLKPLINSLRRKNKIKPNTIFMNLRTSNDDCSRGPHSTVTTSDAGI